METLFLFFLIYILVSIVVSIFWDKLKSIKIIVVLFPLFFLADKVICKIIEILYTS